MTDVAGNVYRLRECGCVRPLHGRCRHERMDRAVCAVLLLAYAGIVVACAWSWWTTP